MIKQVINLLLERKTNISASRKTKEFSRNILLTSRNRSFDHAYKEKWQQLYSKFDKKYPYYCATINDMNDIYYVPENIYYSHIEPVLNNKSFASAYADKNFYENYFREDLQLFPKTLLRGINGHLYTHQYHLIDTVSEIEALFENNTSYILKPAIETSGGARVILVNFLNKTFHINNKSLSCSDFLQYLKKEYQTNFVLQQQIIGNNWFSDFNKSSLNTIRLLTYRSVSNEKVYPLQAVIRFGKPGSIVDNQAAGGFTCGINMDGKINRFAIDKYGGKYLDFEFLSHKINEPIPGFDNMKYYACKLAPTYYYHRILGFDFCFDDANQVRLLEINCKNIEINFLQMNNGPLFGQYTDEVIEYCSKHKKSIVLDYYI